MTKFVSYVSDEAIEKDAQALLAEYAHARGVPIEAPIAIDDIIEKHLKIGIEFDDTHRLFGVPRSGIGFDPDILGAIFFEQKRIVIDESLDPDANPAKEGRYRYTAAHEVGHWRLHRHLFGKDPAQTSMLDGNAPPSVICRTSQAKARIELQADLYASCVLMPRKLVFAAWDEAFPDRKQRVLQPSEPIDHPFVEIARFENRFPGAAFTESDDQALWLKNSSPEERDKQLSATVAALIGIAPKDELEGMMAAQLVAAHNAAMECYRRAMIGEQTFEGRRENLAQANKLSRTYAALLEALNRHRGKGQQKVTVEHVHVHAGGQAVVGMVAAPRQPGGGDASKIEEQPYAKQIAGQIAHAPEPALPRPDAGRDAVPVARDGERALPDARRQGQGRAEGQ